MKFGTETPKCMQFSHKHNVNFQNQKYGTSTDLATLFLMEVSILTERRLFYHHFDNKNLLELRA
jgi:hypothetical protein